MVSVRTQTQSLCVRRNASSTGFSLAWMEFLSLFPSCTYGQDSLLRNARLRGDKCCQVMLRVASTAA